MTVIYTILIAIFAVLLLLIPSIRGHDHKVVTQKETGYRYISYIVESKPRSLQVLLNNLAGDTGKPVCRTLYCVDNEHWYFKLGYYRLAKHEEQRLHKALSVYFTKQAQEYV